MSPGKHCSKFRTETEALIKAVSLIIDSSEAVSAMVLLTNARSVLEALINNKYPVLARAMNDFVPLTTFPYSEYQHTVE